MTDRNIRLDAAIEALYGELPEMLHNKAIEALSALPAVVGWLDIESAPRGEWVLIHRHAPKTQWHGRTEVAQYTTRFGWGSFNRYFPPTHYMPLPAPPEIE